MRHAMIMTVHTNFNILQKFVELFDDTRYDFYILVDKKTKTPNEEIIKQMPKHSKLVILPRMNIYWAGYSQIDAYLRLIETSSEKNYDYYHFLQGSDFPLKTKEYVNDFFEKNQGYEFINIAQKDFARFKCGIYHFFTNNRFSKGIFGWVGFKTYWLPYENIERVAGESKWNFWKLFKYAIDGIINFSQVPLSIASWFGMIMTGFSFIVLAIIIIRKILFGDSVTGWASTICVIILIGGIQMFCLGIIGQYIAKIYLETKRRPHYIISDSNIENMKKIQ